MKMYYVYDFMIFESNNYLFIIFGFVFWIVVFIKMFDKWEFNGGKLLKF